MTNSYPAARSQKPYVLVALVTGLFVGLCGLYPHLRWSLELKQVAWFYNSYDEGYYGWLSMSEWSSNRGISGVVMRGLYLACGSDAQLTMVLADFLLPFGIVLAACFLVRPLS